MTYLMHHTFWHGGIHLPYLLTYLLTAWCKVLLEKLTGLQLVKKFPAFYGTRRFITALTSVRHLSLSWANPIQSIYPHPTSCRSILILSNHLRLGLPSGLFPSGFPTKTLYTPLSSPISFFSILSPAQYWVSSTNHLAPRYAISYVPPLPHHIHLPYLILFHVRHLPNMSPTSLTYAFEQINIQTLKEHIAPVHSAPVWRKKWNLKWVYVRLAQQQTC